MSARALVVAAPASGSGKTTVATGLMAALRRRGTVVAPFKVGPDYIDPGYHALAAGRPGRNLDPVLVGAELIGPLARHGAAGAGLAVVEGVMGLFDGRLADGAGSTAQVAALLGAPVVLVVDCRGQSRSLAALLHGFRSFDPDVRIAGVVLNRVGSERHEAVLRAAADEVGLPVLGALPRVDALAVPSRHLGLITAAEHGAAATAAVDAMAELVTAHVDLDAVAAWCRRAAAGRPGLGAAVGPALPVHGAVFGGPAFTFGYAEHVELLAAAGAEVVVVDPVRDEELPAGTAALVVPGGFPEEHVAALGEREAAGLGAGRGRRGRTGARGVRRAALPVRGAGRGGAGGGAARAGGDDRAADAGIPRRGRARRVAAVRGGFAGGRARVPPLRGDAAGGCRAGVGLARRRARGWVRRRVHASFLHTHPAAHRQPSHASPCRRTINLADQESCRGLCGPGVCRTIRSVDRAEAMATATPRAACLPDDQLG